MRRYKELAERAAEAMLKVENMPRLGSTNLAGFPLQQWLADYVAEEERKND